VNWLARLRRAGFLSDDFNIDWTSVIPAAGAAKAYYHYSRLNTLVRLDALERCLDARNELYLSVVFAPQQTVSALLDHRFASHI
jgi:hypothetical protein